MKSSIIKKSEESLFFGLFLKSFCQAFGWRSPKFLLKGIRKMRQAFKTQVEVERRRFSIFTFNKMLCLNQSFILQPFSWRHSEYLLKSLLNPDRLLPVN